MKPIALQLYSIREEAVRDFPATLKMVADMGYKGVEFAGLHGYDAKEIAKIVNDLGMTVCSSHTGLPTQETVRQVVDTEFKLGNKWVVSGFGPNDMQTIAAVESVAERFSLAAELLRPHEMKFGFHNHWWEFEPVDGRRPFDVIMRNAPLVYSELDTYWAAVAGVDVVGVLQKYGARIPLLHIKDGPMKKGEPHMAVGSGAMDIPSVINAADQSVLQWLIVELDECATDMVEAVRKSYEYLVGEGLAKGNK